MDLISLMTRGQTTQSIAINQALAPHIGCPSSLQCHRVRLMATDSSPSMASEKSVVWSRHLWQRVCCLGRNTSRSAQVRCRGRCSPRRRCALDMRSPHLSSPFLSEQLELASEGGICVCTLVIISFDQLGPMICQICQDSVDLEVRDT